jgi:type II secretory pathway pseudopilin PulG
VPSAQEEEVGKLKKLMLLAALLAMLAVAAIPAIAQVTQEGEQEGESADLNQDASSTQEGDNSIQCSNDQLTGNTGNAQTLNQGISYAGDSVSPAGDATIEMIPNEDVDEVFQCTGNVGQAASASG